MATRAAYFSRSEAQILMEAYEEVKDIIKKKGNTATVIKQREKAWQSIADRLNALNMNGPKRTWQQVKIKYKNILQNAVKKNTHRQGTGGGSPKADLTPAEDMVLELNKGRPVLEGIPGGKETSIGSSQDATRFIQVSGSPVFLLEPPAQAPDDADPGEGPSAAATAHDGDDDDEEETISLDSRRHEVSWTQMLYSGKTAWQHKLTSYQKVVWQPPPAPNRTGRHRHSVQEEKDGKSCTGVRNKKEDN
uniref:uncharacterized protein LOC124007975 isoform X2 n=1 Tax=Oncorhynchus gorbuscha TaxID=8017 RepID=UPI001EAE8591|nr:uncharacterized protein LOC124007975 isoform X2 [Oncorhynchus gorbuscha]